MVVGAAAAAGALAEQEPVSAPEIPLHDEIGSCAVIVLMDV